MKRIAFILLIFLLPVFSLCACSKRTNNVTTLPVTVVIDAGHGGIDSGVVGVNSGIEEAELNLSVAFKLKEYFENGGIRVVMTRTSAAVFAPDFKRRDMERRRDIILAAEPNLVISVHMNKYSDRSRRGAQVFFGKNERGKALANLIQTELNGMETATRSLSALIGDYYIINCNDYPTCIVECGFLSSPEDEALLLRDDYQYALSYAIYRGAVAFLLSD